MLLFRIILTVNYFGAIFFSTTCLLLLSPVLLLHGPLRARGVAERYLPGCMLQKLFSRWILLCAGVSVKRHLAGQSSKETLSSGAIYMYNHTSYLDACVTMAYCPVAPKPVMKKVLMFTPLFGQMVLLYGGVAIDRGNREKAIASCNKLVKKLVAKHQYIIVSPEGTRSSDATLLPFKKGPFHMALQGNAPVIPVILENAWRLMPKSSFLVQSGCVEITYLPPLMPKKDEEVDELMARTRAAFEGVPLNKGKGRKPSFFVQWVCPTFAAASWMYGLFCLIG